MRFPFTTTIERGDEEIELTVIYSVTPFVAATYYQPAEGGEVEVVSVKRAGKEFRLTDDEEDALLAECQGRAMSDIAEEAAEAAEWRAQCRRDDRLMEQWERGR